MIKYSDDQIQIETIQKVQSKFFLNLNESEKAFFFYNIRENLRDIIIAICFLKSRFIGDSTWFKIKNLGFNIIHNHIVLSNYLNANLNVLGDISSSPHSNKMNSRFLSSENSNENICKMNNLKQLKFNSYLKKIQGFFQWFFHLIDILNGLSQGNVLILKNSLNCVKR